MSPLKEKKLNILHIEDNPADVVYIQELLSDDSYPDYSITDIPFLSESLDYLCSNEVDIVLLDLSLPDSSGIETFLAVKENVPDLPVIVMTGLNDEDLGIVAVQEGAQDYLVKGKVEADLLVRSISYAIEREKLVVKLRDALDQIKILRGLLPICAHCKNIRDDKGFWHQVEEYVTSHADVQFTHGICPVCAKKYYPDLYSNKKD